MVVDPSTALAAESPAFSTDDAVAGWPCESSVAPPPPAVGVALTSAESADAPDALLAATL